MKTEYIIKVGTKRFVKGYTKKHDLVTLTTDIEQAKGFRSERAVNKWCDEHVSLGQGLTWLDEITFLKFNHK